MNNYTSDQLLSVFMAFSTMVKEVKIVIFFMINV